MTDAATQTAPPVVRSPADVLRLVVAGGTLAILLILQWLFGSAIVGFAHDLLRGVDAIGTGVITAVVAVVRVATVVLLAAGLVKAIVTGRWRLLATVAVAAAFGLALFALVNRWIDVDSTALTELADWAGPLTSTWFPTSGGLAVAAAVATAAGPSLPRRYRRIGWALVFGLAATRFIAAPVSGAALIAVVCGWTGGAAAVTLLGTPSRRPSRDAVIEGLRAAGVEVATLEAASVDARGSTPYFGTTPDGQSLFVKVLARDERSADLLFRLYRSIQPRDLGDERPFSSLRRAVEHEALVALAATSLGVHTPSVRGFARAEPGGFTLCYEGVAGRSLDRVETDDVTDAVLGQIWSQLAALRRHGVAHRDLRLANLFLDKQGKVWMIDFGFSELAASDLLLRTDLAELVTALSLKVGPARTVRAASAAVGSDALRDALPRLQPKFLSGATRTAIKQEPDLLDEIRREVAAGLPPGGTRRAA